MTRLVPCRIALDLGTTSLAGRLFDDSGRVLSEQRIANPQARYGHDILARLQAAHEGEGAALQRLLVDGVRCLVESLLAAAGVNADQIRGVAAAGNPGISSLLRNAPVARLLLPPHKAPWRGLVELSVDELALGLPVALQLLPPLSGFVGGDLLSGLLAFEATLADGEIPPPALLVDLGTNAEMALWDGTRWLVSSAAAGPAFEGGGTSCGMLAGEGAVTDVRLAGDRLRLTVTGGGRPRGLCGSGLVALVAAACDGGLIEASGRIVDAAEVETNLARYLVSRDGVQALCFYRDAAGELLLTQQDVRSLQLGKGAVCAGVRSLLQKAGLEPADVAVALITGALGSNLPLRPLKRVALLPEPVLENAFFTANAVLDGLQHYLAAEDGQSQLDDLLERVQPLPLSGTPAFEREFLAALNF
jgi:uncharacterized 2Fe-2S/4Fe-4S cluster protein (DUF4445 family)